METNVTVTERLMPEAAPASGQKLLYGKAEAAKLLSISVRCLDYLIAQKDLDVRRIGARVLIPRAALLEFVRRDHTGRAK